ncbi:MAG: hypothetical protein MUE35_10495 [Hydrogenophaga sp.]|jgi:hypothetical protein|nr:hypothetical protein [Hydrogenophaga sp.]
MDPPIGLTTPVKAAFGEWLCAFYAQFYPDTPAGVEWAARGHVKAMQWAPGRMVDDVESMLSSYKRVDNSGKASTSTFLPAVFAAVAADYTETPGEAGRHPMHWRSVAIPGDTLKRHLQVRVMSADLRAQIVVVASDAPTAMSIIGQLVEWAKVRRTFHARYHFQTLPSDWPVVVQSEDRMAVPTPIGEHLSILTLDLKLRAGMPMFRGPTGDDATDGQTPPGYPVLEEITHAHDPTLGPPTGVSPAEWRNFRALAGTIAQPASNAPSAPAVVLWPLAGK